MHCPALGRVPSNTACDPDLVLKLTPTGVTFLGTYNEETKKYEATGRFRKRYTGSKQFAVDITGKLWLSAKDLQAHIDSYKKPEPVRKKKNGINLPVDTVKLFVTTNNKEQISEISAEPENFATKVAKKERKKTYRINKKEVRHRIFAYVNTQKGKKELYFWTVSFPKGTPDTICFQALNIWLTQLRQYKLLKDYIRVTERQDNGTIHFHIAIPHRMPVQKANSMMRGTLKTFAKRGLIPYKPHSPQICKYNGVDICKNRKTKRVTNFAIKKGARALSTYLTKYVTKNDEEFDNLAWHNSRGFTGLFTAVTFTITEFNDYGFGHFLNRVRRFKMNFAVFVPWLYGPPPLLVDHLYKLNSYIQTQLENG